MNMLMRDGQDEPTSTGSPHPHIRHREDVPHEGALADFYGRSPLSMVGGGVAFHWSTREEAIAGIHAAKIVSSVEEYHSESLIITRVVSLQAGTYFLVVESDCVFPEDVDALEALGVEVGEPWRTRVLETSYWGRPHPALAMSSTFQVHVVHPGCPDSKTRRTVLV
jgi:hypothetical protein